MYIYISKYRDRRLNFVFICNDISVIISLISMIEPQSRNVCKDIVNVFRYI